MPKIPVFQSETQVTAQGPRGMVDVGQYGVEGRGAAQLAQGLSDLWGSAGETGKELTAVGVKYHNALTKAKQSTDLLDLQTRYLTDLYGIKDAFKVDPDFNTAGQRAQMAVQELQQKYLRMNNDPEVQHSLIKSTMHVSLDAVHGIKTESNKKRTDHGVATLNRTLDTFGHLYAKSTTDTEKDTLLSNAQTAIQNSQSAMYIDEVEGGKRWKKFQSSIMETEIMGMMRQDPIATRSRLMDPQFAPGLDEKARERFLAASDRVIDQRLRQADIAERRAIRDDERAEKAGETQVKKEQTINFSTLAARQVTGSKNPLRPGEAEQMLSIRAINEEGYKQLMDRQTRDLEKDINEGEQYLDGLFRTRSPLESIDPVNEAYRARIKKELRDRVREGEMPQDVLNDIEIRESVKPKPPATFPRPKFLTGDKTNLTAIKQAGQITADKYNAGDIDSKTALRELRNIKDLERSVEYHLPLEKDHKEPKKGSKPIKDDSYESTLK